MAAKQSKVRLDTLLGEMRIDSKVKDQEAVNAAAILKAASKETLVEAANAAIAAQMSAHEAHVDVARIWGHKKDLDKKLEAAELAKAEAKVTAATPSSHETESKRTGCNLRQTHAGVAGVCTSWPTHCYRAS